MNRFKARVLEGSVDVPKAAAYRPDRLIQEALWETNQRLQDLEQQFALQQADLPEPTLLFVTYVPRSGSTVLTQLLARTGDYNYVSNFQARFWLAPFVGGLLEKNVAPRKTRNLSLESDYGLTPGVSSPNEFSYFWEHWLGLEHAESHCLSESQWDRVQIEDLMREFRLLGSLYGGPLMFKKEWLGMNAGHFLRHFPTLKVVHVRRNPLEVAQSILKARRAVHGSRDCWWGARPSNYLEIAGLSWATQIAAQIQGILADTARWENAYPNRFLTVDFAELAGDVRGCVQRVGEFAGVVVRECGGPRDLERLPFELRYAELRTPSEDLDLLKGALDEEGLPF